MSNSSQQKKSSKDSQKGGLLSFKQTILASSSLASLLSQVIINPFDVIKVRQQIAYTKCSKHKQIYKPNAFTKQIKKSLQYIKENSIHNSCECQEASQIIKTVQKIIKKEGFQTFMNGIQYSLMFSLTSNISYYYIYEHTQRQFAAFIKNSILLPLLSASFSRAISTSLTFPFEFLRTYSNAQIGVKRSSIHDIYDKRQQMYSGYFVTLYRDIIFSALYWTMVENIRKSLKKNQFLYNNVLITNIICGSISGGATSFLTAPLDVIKTRIQVNNPENKQQVQLLKATFQKQGIKGLFIGANSRVFKSIIHNATYLSLYESFKKFFLGSEYYTF